MIRKSLHAALNGRVCANACILVLLAHLAGPKHLQTFFILRFTALRCPCSPMVKPLGRHVQ